MKFHSSDDGSMNTITLNSFDVQGIDGVFVQIYTQYSQAEKIRGRWQVLGTGAYSSIISETVTRTLKAIESVGMGYPFGYFTVDFHPSEMPKNLPHYELPLAIGALVASGKLKLSDEQEMDKMAFVGKLSINGETRPISGALPFAYEAKQLGFKEMFLPKENAKEAAMVDGLKVYPVESLSELVSHLSGECLIDPQTKEDLLSVKDTDYFGLRFDDVKGQSEAKRALEVATAGHHNILFNGSKGTGKTMLAQAVKSILPALTLEEALEVTKIYSAVGKMPKETNLITRPPFVDPHYSSSIEAIVGGGTGRLTPGAVTLAHRGVLFLDELPNFRSLDALRTVLQDGMVTIMRSGASGKKTFPASFMLIAAMNPCPCGYLDDPKISCSCSEERIQTYQNKISGPLRDRIDMHVEMPYFDYNEIRNKREESHLTVRKRVEAARQIQLKRFEEVNVSRMKAGLSPILYNSEMTPNEVKRYCQLDNDSNQILDEVCKEFNLSGRAIDSVLKISMTIANLASREKIDVVDVTEAIIYRNKYIPPNGRTGTGD